MPFNDTVRVQVKNQSNFTCCWCNNRANTVEVHHIVPQAQGGSDAIDNAAPLCGSCHTLYGGNPDLRREITLRRDAWYKKCAEKPEFLWPVDIDVPLLAYSREIQPRRGTPLPGIQFTDKDPAGTSGPPLLYVSVYFKTSKFFVDHVPQTGEKWLYIQADMRPALNVRVQVRAWNDRDVEEFISTLESGQGGYNLQGPRPGSNEEYSGDYLYVWREDDELRFMIAAFTPSNAGISVHARLTVDVAKSFSDYLRRSGFSNGVESRQVG